MDRIFPEHYSLVERIVMALIALLALVLFVALAAQVVSPARAHKAPTGWTYPLVCCSNKDCREVEDAAVSEEGGGFRIVATGELVPYGSHKLKDSPDGKVHLCTYQGKADTAAICLFVPPRAY